MLIRSQQRGFTLLELMIVVAIIGILAAVGLPSFNDQIERSNLTQAIEAIYSDLRFARSESIKRSEDISVTFTDGASWNYVIADSGGTTIKTVSNTQFSVASVVSNFTSDIVTFDFVRGTANAGTITVTANDATTGTVTVSLIGRVKSDY